MTKASPTVNSKLKVLVTPIGKTARIKEAELCCYLNISSSEIITIIAIFENSKF